MPVFIVPSTADITDPAFWAGLLVDDNSTFDARNVDDALEITMTGSSITITDAGTGVVTTFTDADLGGGSFSNFVAFRANDADADISGSVGLDSFGYRGGDGDDTIKGGAGRDRLNGEDGNDRLFGGNGFDTLTGGLGDDSLVGGGGQDVLRGGSGRDTLDGGAGKDILTGGGSGAWSVNVSNGTSQGVYCRDRPTCTTTVQPGDTTLIVTAVTTGIGSYTLTVRYVGSGL